MIPSDCVKFLLVLLSLVALSTAQRFPNYVKPCRISDVNIDQCLLEHGNTALKIIIRGDKSQQIASFIPTWTIPKMGGQLSEKVKYIQINTRASKFETLKLIYATYNATEESIFFQAEMPVLLFTAKYDMDVELLEKRLTGKGNMNATMENLSYSFKIFLGTETRNNAEYYKVLTSTFDISASNASFLYHNLFQGHLKGDEANKFINDNWTMFMGAVGSSWMDFMNSITAKLFDKFMRMVPKDQFLLP